MSENCTSCGAGLIPGARFCRFCGERTGELISEELPTRIMTEGSTKEPPLFGSGYARPVLPVQPPAVTSAFPRRSGKGWVWLVVLALIVIIGSVAAGLVYITARSSRRVGRDSPRSPAAPSILAPAPGGSVFSEESAAVSSRETIYHQRFRIEPGETFAITNINGDITVEAWDQPEVDVKMTKRGASPQVRRSVQVSAPHKNGELGLMTASDRNDVKVIYEVRVPRELKRLRIESVNSGVRVEGMNTDLEITLQSGSVTLDRFSGSARTNVTAGETKVVLEDISASGEMAFNSMAGDIEIKLDSDLDVNLFAEARIGDIRLDEALGVSLVKNLLGQSAKGQIGNGGRPLKVRTVTGDIKIER